MFYRNTTKCTCDEVLVTLTRVGIVGNGDGTTVGDFVGTAEGEGVGTGVETADGATVVMAD